MNILDNKVVILCGGRGTRIKKFRKKVPKPLIKIKNKTILQRIIKIYANQGFKNFLILTGYKNASFNNFFVKGNLNIKFINTGIDTGTAERLYKIRRFIKNEDFFLTYGDTIGDFKLANVIKIKNKKFLISLTSFPFYLDKGIITYNKKKYLSGFFEKNYKFNFNSGYYFIKKEFFKILKKKDVSLENDVLPRLVKKNLVIVSQELKNWLPIDTRDDYYLARRFIKC